MKTSILLLVMYSLFSLFYGCNNPNSKNNAEIEFLTQEIDLSNLKFGEVKVCTFEFNNSGNSQLIIQDVKTSCGCTDPYWPDKPLKPGENGKIEVKYVSMDAGVFVQHITVFYNGYNSPITLIIKGEVRFT